MAFYDSIKKAFNCPYGIYNLHGELIAGDEVGFKETEGILFDGNTTYIKTKDAVIAVNAQLSKDACDLLKYSFEYQIKKEAAQFMQPLDYIIKNDVSEESVAGKYQGYRVMYIKVKEDIKEIIDSIYEGQKYETAKDDDGIYIVKEIEDAEQEADSLISGIVQENGINIVIGCGRKIKDKYTIKDSASHSKDAVSIAIKMGFKEEFFDIDKMAIYGIMYSSDIKKINYYTKGGYFGFHDIASDKELLATAEEILKCDLNISEASRRLYIHRNTLLYRLEKIKNLTGLDIKKFDEAMVFQTIMSLYRVRGL